MASGGRLQPELPLPTVAAARSVRFRKIRTHGTLWDAAQPVFPQRYLRFSPLGVSAAQDRFTPREGPGRSRAQGPETRRAPIPRWTRHLGRSKTPFASAQVLD